MNVTVMETEAGLRLMCEWFVMCDRPAEWASAGPDGEMMPICQRCADKVGIPVDELHEYELNTEEA